MPSASGALTSTRCLSSVRTASRLPALTASTSRSVGPAALRLAIDTTPISNTRRTIFIRDFFSDFLPTSFLTFFPTSFPTSVPTSFSDSLHLKPPRADAESVDLTSELLREVEHQVRQRRFLRRLQVPVALHQARAAARDERRDVQ